MYPQPNKRSGKLNCRDHILRLYMPVNNECDEAAQRERAVRFSPCTGSFSEGEGRGDSSELPDYAALWRGLLPQRSSHL